MKKKILFKTMNRYFLFLLITFLYSCSEDDPNPSTSPNILFIIADDMGKDATFGFSEGSIKPNTPNINHLKNTGLTFTNLWVYSTCSPTRAAIITGKYGYRTGVKWAGDELSDSEYILHKYIKQRTNNEYATALIGKWHLSGNNSNVNPETFGMDYYTGLANGSAESYYKWRLTENGAFTMQTEYITEKFTDLAIDWVGKQKKPWFLWLAYTAPHTPFHKPPSEMHSQGNLPEYAAGMDPLPFFMAAIEAMDYQIGRFLKSLSEEEKENTVIIFISDNGTTNQVAQMPYSGDRVKGTLYQGGINTPMIISGKGVSRNGIDENLISCTDLYATIADIAGINVSEIHDSKSFKPLLTTSTMHRPTQYSEMNNGTGDKWTIRNQQYKLIVNANGDNELYNIISDPYETINILNDTVSSEQEQAETELETDLSNIRN